jgi:cytochrome c peroxidase
VDMLDLLDSIWRQQYGKHLIEYSAASGAAELSWPCHIEEELKSRVSTLADVLKRMAVPDEVLPSGAKVPGDQTAKRLQLWADKNVELQQRDQVKSALDTLRAVNAVRNSYQHSGAAWARRAALAQLGTSATSPPGERWDAICRKVSEALSTLAEAIPLQHR